MPHFTRRRRILTDNPRYDLRKFPGIVDFGFARDLALASGDSVASWPGQLGQINWVQAVSAAKPVFGHNTYAGGPGVTFSTDDFLTDDNLAASLSGEDISYTLMLFVRQPVPAAQQTLFSFANTASTTQYSRARITASGAVSLAIQGSGDGSALFSDSSLIAPSIEYFLAYAVRGTAVEGWVNGRMVSSVANAGSITATGATLGCWRRTSTAQHLDGTLGGWALALGTPPSIEEFRRVERYYRRFFNHVV